MSKRQQRIQPKSPVSSASIKTDEGSVLNAFNKMVVWLIALVTILPVLYSNAGQDPVLSIRYGFLSGFLLVFTSWFFLYHKNFSLYQIPVSVKIIFGLGLAYTLWMAMSMFTAINYREGYYEIGRHLLNLILLFAVMLVVLNEQKRMVNLYKALVMVAAFHSVAGILQYYDIGFSNLLGFNDKPYGFMANRNVFGSALMLLSPFVIYMLCTGGKTWRIISSIAGALLVWALLLSQTRSAWLAVGGIVLVSLLLVLIFSKQNRKQWLMGASASIAAAIVIVALVLVTNNDGKLKQSVTERIKSFTRSGVTNDVNGKNADERLMFWQKTISLIKDKPVTGCGAGNWKIAIPAYGSEGMAEATGKYAPDRAHNVYLQLAAEDGVPGALLYFGMWLVIAFIAIKIILQPKDEQQRILIIFMLSGLVGLAIDSVFSFATERMEHSVFIFIIAGIIMGSYVSNKSTNEKAIVSKPIAIALMLICIVNLFMAVAKYKYEEHWSMASYYEEKGQYAEMLQEAEAGKNSIITLGPGGLPLEVKTAGAYQAMRQNDKALVEINKALQYNPNSSLIWNYRGAIHAGLGQYEEALSDFLKAKKLTPKFAMALKNLAMDYYYLKQYKECITTLNEINITGDSYFQSIKDNAQKMVEAQK